MPATSSPIDRAKVLCEKIAEKYPGRAVHLIGMCRSRRPYWRAHADSRITTLQDTAWCVALSSASKCGVILGTTEFHFVRDIASNLFVLTRL